jgi:hypothetical protein
MPFTSIWLLKQHRLRCGFAQNETEIALGMLEFEAQQALPQIFVSGQHLLPLKQTSVSPGQHLLAQITLGQHVPLCVPWLMHD